MGRPGWIGFLAWVPIGIMGLLGILGLLSIGVIVLAITVPLAARIARAAPFWPHGLGSIVGGGVVLTYAGLANINAPRPRLTPAPLLGAALLLVLVPVILFASLKHRAASRVEG